MPSGRGTCHRGHDLLMELREVYRDITEESFKKMVTSQVPVAHACNPSYSGGRDQEDCSLRPGWANSL
jgi:hypothetical protein